MELLARVQAEDVTGLQELFDKYWDMLWDIATKKTGDAREAEDIVQELFIDIWYNKRSLKINSSFRNYLISSLYLKIFKSFRTKGLRQKHYDEFARILQDVDLSTENLDLSVAELEDEYAKLSDLITDTVALMPPVMQRVFSLKHVEGYSYTEIAEKLNVSTTTVKTHLKLAMSRLRKAGDEYPAPLVLLPALLAHLQSLH